MRRAGRWTRLRYRFARLGDRIAYAWACVLAAAEELAILLGLRPRHIAPPRYGIHVPGSTPRQAAHRVARDPRFYAPSPDRTEVES